MIGTADSLGTASRADLRPHVAPAATCDPGRMASVDEALGLVTAAGASACMIERVRLEDAGIKGNMHEMFLDRNSQDVIKFIDGWVNKNIK